MLGFIGRGKRRETGMVEERSFQELVEERVERELFEALEGLERTEQKTRERVRRERDLQRRPE